MEPLVHGRRIRAFKAADAFAVEVFRVSKTLSDSDAGLARQIRQAAVRCGGALVAASGSPPGSSDDHRWLGKARGELLEGRYYIYLARRLGLLDLRRYKSLTLRQDAALKELDALVPSI